MWDHSSTKQVCHHQCSNKSLRYPTPVSSLLLHLRSKDLWMQKMIMEQWTHEGTKLGTLSQSLIWWILFPHVHVCRLRAAFMWERSLKNKASVSPMWQCTYMKLWHFQPQPHEYFIVASQKQDLWMQKIIYGTVDVWRYKAGNSLSLYIYSKHHNSINYVKLENAFEFYVLQQLHF